MSGTFDDLGPPRWRGQPGRLEVWYLTATDPVAGAGLWLHHEVVAPTNGAPAFGHGWVALFPADRPPVWRRFGPAPVDDPAESSRWFSTGGAIVAGDRVAGATEEASWDLSTQPTSPPLWTFPRWAWEREVLPGAQVLAAPTMRLSGRVVVAGEELVLDEAPGGFARIYGHGNAARWAWLHAELGDGDVLEVVAGVSRRPGLRTLPPAPFVRMRLGGRDLPRSPLVPGRVAVELPTWSMTVPLGRRRLRTSVTIPDGRCVRIGYVDPDGATATCVNSERADAEVLLERFDGRWRVERRWVLDGVAHSEVGLRP